MICAKGRAERHSPSTGKKNSKISVQLMLVLLVARVGRIQEAMLQWCSWQATAHELIPLKKEGLRDFELKRTTPYP